MSNKEPGYVYILTNPSFREDWVKIGKMTQEWFRVHGSKLKDNEGSNSFLGLVKGSN